MRCSRGGGQKPGELAPISHSARLEPLHCSLGSHRAHTLQPVSSTTLQREHNAHGAALGVRMARLDVGPAHAMAKPQAEPTPAPLSPSPPGGFVRAALTHRSSSSLQSPSASLLPSMAVVASCGQERVPHGVQAMASTSWPALPFFMKPGWGRVPAGPLLRAVWARAGSSQAMHGQVGVAGGLRP